MNTLEENKPMVKNMATSLGENTPYSLIPRFTSNISDGEGVSYFLLRRAKSLAEYRLFLGNKIMEV